MKKDTQFTLRIPAHLKRDLQDIAKLEGRSAAQICEAFLRAGSEAYRNGAGSSFTDLSQSRPSKDLKKKFLVCLFWFEKIANCCEIILLGVFAHPHNEVRVCA